MLLRIFLDTHGRVEKSRLTEESLYHGVQYTFKSPFHTQPVNSDQPYLKVFLIGCIISIDLPPGFDNSIYPPGMEKVPRRFAISKANRYMVDHTDYLIAYTWHPASNARNLVEYAMRKNVAVTYIV